jgi:hypothetical protein
MKKIVIFIMCVFNFLFFEKYILSQNNNLSESVKILFDNYFKPESYTILGDEYKFAEKKFIVAVQYINNKNKFIKKGIVAEVENNQTIIHLYINDEQVLNRDKVIIFDLSKNHDKLLMFYGYKIEIFPNKLNIHNGMLDLTPYFITANTKIRAFDYVSFNWNKNINLFKKYEQWREIDR